MFSLELFILIISLYLIFLYKAMLKIKVIKDMPTKKNSCLFSFIEFIFKKEILSKKSKLIFSEKIFINEIKIIAPKIDIYFNP